MIRKCIVGAGHQDEQNIITCLGRLGKNWEYENMPEKSNFRNMVKAATENGNTPENMIKRISGIDEK